MSEQKWAYTHEGRCPSNNRSVAVLVAHKDGTFSADVGRYYGEKGWGLNFFTGAPVVGWVDLPDYRDHVEIVDVEESEAA